VYKWIIINAKLRIGTRGQKTGRCQLRRRRYALDCRTIEEEEEEEEEEELAFTC
jgi:hypothetical protein